MDRQIKRIADMEAAMERVRKAVDGLESALEEYSAVAGDIKSLEEYLNSPERRQDVKSDEEGKLPEGLRRGVLSEDELWELLERNDELAIRLHIN